MNQHRRSTHRLIQGAPTEAVCHTVPQPNDWTPNLEFVPVGRGGYFAAALLGFYAFPAAKPHVIIERSLDTGNGRDRRIHNRVVKVSSKQEFITRESNYM